MTVHAMWVEPIVPITGGHHITHEINGQDEINIANLRNYQELVATPLADIASFAKSNGTNDNAIFLSLIANSKKIYIPPNVTLKLGYTTSGSFIDINKPIEIYGGGTIEFIGDFSVNNLIRVSSNNVVFRNINFTNNTGTIASFANAFIYTFSTNNVSNLLIENCTFSNGCVNLNTCNNSIFRNNTMTNGWLVGMNGTSNRIEKNNIQAPTSTSATGITGINLLAYATYTAKDWYIGYNTITNVCWSGITCQQQQGVITNCLVEGNTIKVAGNVGTNGVIPISFSGGFKMTCRNNDIYATNFDGHYFGIECVNTSQCLVEGNKIEGMLRGIIVNGTVTGKSFNNVVKNNFINNFSLIGLTLDSFTTGNLVRDNYIKSSTISSTSTVYSIYFNANSKSDFQLNQCLSNKVEIDGSGLSSATGIYGIYAYGPRCKIKDNVITITAPNKAYGLVTYAGDNFGLNYGKNMDITNNEFIISATDLTNVYGILITHTGTNDSLTNTIIQYNRISVLAPSGLVSWIASTSYALNTNVLPITMNGYYYTCVVAGTSGTTEPTWTTTLNATVTDGSAVWQCKGGKGLFYTLSKVGNGIVSNNYFI
jgi:hypothetical protein